MRDLSVALNKVGEVARARGEWAQAEAAHRESLYLRRQLVERIGGTPESLGDLVTSLKNLAGLPSANPEYLGEANEISADLAARFPEVERHGQLPTDG